LNGPFFVVPPPLVGTYNLGSGTRLFNIILSSSLLAANINLSVCYFVGGPRQIIFNFVLKAKLKLSHVVIDRCELTNFSFVFVFSITLRELNFNSENK
jgi:hypothetical protein